ncbi:MAG: hypothetical protein ACTTKL_02835 [Treponema sp.]
MKRIAFAFVFLCAAFSLGAQPHISTQPHQDAVSVVTPAAQEADFSKAYISAGKDGFLIKWTEDNQGEHYQISEYEIKAAAVSPDGRFVAVYETDGGLVNRLALWDWETLSRKWARRYKDSITSLSFTENGTYIIAGTATVSGAEFIRAATGDVASGKIKDATGIVSYAVTNSAETTAAMYSPAGSLAFYDLTTGRAKQRVSVTQGLSQAVLFNNFLFLAGVKNNAISVAYCITGKPLATIKAANPILLASKSDRNLYYLENDGKGLYTLKMLENRGNRTVSNPRIVRTFTGPRGSGAITSGAKLGNEIMLGSSSGAVYKISADTGAEQGVLEPITQDIYDRILDTAPAGEDFYFLTHGALFRSSYDSGVVKRLGDNPGRTQVIAYGDAVILWSKGTRKPVVLFDYAQPTVKTLYTPKTSLQSLRLFGSILVDVESSVSVNVYDMEKGALREAYSGAGLQDCVLAADGRLYVAKSLETNPRCALLAVDMTTGETVPTPVAGNVAFGLSVHENDIYGVGIQETGAAKRTTVFRYNTASRQSASVANFTGDFPDAFTYLYFPALYTNIGQNVGQNSIRFINLSDRKSIIFNRSASMPVKAARNAARVVILNRDGSISWYDDSAPQALVDWYLTKEGQWFEF